MAVLSCKTRGGSDPQGKRKVWFCAHPEDYPIYLDKIADQILRIKNCAVYYYGEPGGEYDWETLQEDICQMQMIVIPVTSRFLSTDNRALMLEFPCAVTHHIPVLPLIQEEGLEKLFNEKCGEIQFLDEYAQDDTAEPYEEKLTRFINRVLAGDELEEKIRQAFHAYIFLSYRKKDRKYAQKLMRLIHKHDFCRDMAIWYDEYLVPGENFNKAIAEMLEKSELFAMAVTPNLIVEDNYIRREEYPLAKRLGKTVLPIQMIPTDVEQLQQQYGDVGAVTDVNCPDALRKALFDGLAELAKKPVENDPEHNFFIGLAYLQGIDVEVDTDRAVELLEKSAQGNFPEAMRMLRQIYWHGDCVEQDRHKALHWQQTLVKCLWENNEASSMDENRKILCQSMLQLSRDMYNLGMTDKARLVAHMALDESSLEDRSQCCQELSKMFREHGDLLEALSWSALGVKVDKELAEKNGTLETSEALARSYLDLGAVRRDMAEPEEAEACFLCAVRILEKRVELEGTVYDKSELATALKSLAQVNISMGQLGRAQDYAIQAKTLMETVSAETRTGKDIRLLVSIYDLLGDLKTRQGDVKGAENHLHVAVVNKLILAENEKTPGSQRSVAVTCSRMASLAETAGEYERAYAFHKQALDIFTKMHEQMPMPSDLRNICLAHLEMGRVLRHMGDLKNAGSHYDQAVTLAQTLAEQIPTMDSRRLLMESYGAHGDLLKTLGDPGAAEEQYRKALKEGAAVANKTGAMEDHSRMASVSHRLGYMQLQRGIIQEAELFLTQAVRIMEIVHENTDNPKAEKDLMNTLLDLGACFVAQKRYPQAFDSIKKAVEQAKQIAGRTDIPSAQRDLYVALQRLGEVYQKTGDPERSLACFLEALDIAQKLFSKSRNVADIRDLAVLHGNLMDMYVQRKNLEKAKEHGLQSLAYSKLCEEKTKAVTDRRRVASCCRSLGYIFENLGQGQEAGQYYVHSFDLRASVASETKSVADWRLMGNGARDAGNFFLRQKNAQEGFDRLGQAINIWKAVVNITKADQDMHALALSYYNLSSVVRPPEVCLREALNIWSALLEKDPQNSTYRKYLLTIMDQLGQ